MTVTSGAALRGSASSPFADCLVIVIPDWSCARASIARHGGNPMRANKNGKPFPVMLAVLTQRSGWRHGTMVAMLRDEVLRRRRRRAAAVAVLSIALGSALFLPSRRTASLPRGAAYAAIAGRPPAVSDPAEALTPPEAIRLAGIRTAVPRVQPIPRAVIDYTPDAEAAAAGPSTTFAPLALAALEGAPAAGGYFPGDAPMPLARSGSGFSIGGGAFAISGGAGGGAAPGGDTVATPPTDQAGAPAPDDPGTAPATTDPAAPTAGHTPATPATNDAAAAPADVAVAPRPTDPAPVEAHPVVPTTAESGDTVAPDSGALDPATPSSPPGHGIGAVPEPATWAMLLIGFGATGAAMRRRRRARALA
jgi:hypothetical protein